MNLNIKFFLIFAIFVSGFVWAEKGLDKILRDAIIENGFKSPEEIYLNPNEELAPQGKIFFKSKHLSLNGKMTAITVIDLIIFVVNGSNILTGIPIKKSEFLIDAWPHGKELIHMMKLF